ncbi:MAG: transcription termination/antitermination protein NusG [Merdibacter sp.]
MSEPKKEWYVVNTYAGHENRVKENLERRIETMGLQDFLFQIVVAEEKEIEYKNGKEVEKTKNLFSGYLFVQMIMTDEAWYIVRNTPGVTGFIGSSGGGAKPFPVAEEEMENILRRLGRAQKDVQIDFDVKDRVKILGGAFKGSQGTVEALDPARQVATVLLVPFGREMPTEIPYSESGKNRIMIENSFVQLFFRVL